MTSKWFLFLLLCFPAFGQGLIYDQRATNIIEGAAFIGDSNEPMGQSFKPTLSTVGFISLLLYDADALHSLGATLRVNVRSNSISGPILGASEPVFMPDNFLGVTKFIFSTAVPVIPGVAYYFQPFIQSGDNWGSYLTDGSYIGGSAISHGVPIIGRNLWFQEGIVVPEPSSALLVLLGSGLFVWHTRENRKR